VSFGDGRSFERIINERWSCTFKTQEQTDRDCPGQIRNGMNLPTLICPFAEALIEQILWKMLEPKMSTKMLDDDMLAKIGLAVKWCQRPSGHASKNGGKSWRYALIQHHQIADNMGLDSIDADLWESMI
jgi:hypothetical protein